MPKFDVTESATFTLPSFPPVAAGLKQLAHRQSAARPEPFHPAAFVYRAGPSPRFGDDHDYEEDGNYAELSVGRDAAED